jgi:ribose 5-phosphate isomerase A
MEDKEIAAIEALKYVENNQIIGLGTGSTANYFIKHLGEKVFHEKLNIKVVASSTISEIEASMKKLQLTSMDIIDSLDLYVDGADEITESLSILKGRGYDLVKEKLLAFSAKKFIVISDASKLVKRIGDNFKIPIEVYKDYWKLAKKNLDKFGEGNLRLNAKGDAFAISSAGNYIMDYSFAYNDIKDIQNKILSTAGVIECGIFYNLCTKAIISENGKINSLDLS